MLYPDNLLFLHAVSMLSLVLSVSMYLENSQRKYFVFVTGAGNVFADVPTGQCGPSGPGAP